MSKLDGLKYALVIGVVSTKTFVELVDEGLHSASYAHNATRSKVVSAKNEFVRLLQSVFRETKEGELNTFAKLAAALYLGKYHIDSNLWSRFISRLAFSVGYRDLPTSDDATRVFQIMMEDYIASNPYLSVEVLTEIDKMKSAMEEIEPETEIAIPAIA